MIIFAASQQQLWIDARTAQSARARPLPLPFSRQPTPLLDHRSEVVKDRPTSPWRLGSASKLGYGGGVFAAKIDVGHGAPCTGGAGCRSKSATILGVGRRRKLKINTTPGPEPHAKRKRTRKPEGCGNVIVGRQVCMTPLTTADGFDDEVFWFGSASSSNPFSVLASLLGGPELSAAPASILEYRFRKAFKVLCLAASCMAASSCCRLVLVHSASGASSDSNKVSEVGGGTYGKIHPIIDSNVRKNLESSGLLGVRSYIKHPPRTTQVPIATTLRPAPAQ